MPNSSFEEGETFPTGWNIVTSDFCNIPASNYQSSVEWSSSRSSTGSKSVGITNVYLPNQGDYTSVKIASEFILINPIQIYNLSALIQGTTGNKGIKPEIDVCFYDKDGNKTGINSVTSQYPPDDKTWYGISFGGLKLSYFPPNTTKIKVGLSANCSYQFLPPGAAQDCSGSIWLDDISLLPLGNITMHKFEDLNKNGLQDINEPNLQYWEMSVYKEANCDSSKEIGGASTDASGNAIFKNTPFGDYSVKETFYYEDFNPPPHLVDATKEGWYTTTPLCQNVTLDSTSGATVNIGNFHGPSFPYLSQLDPAWKDLTYDHASTSNPFFCGTTIGGCGCAITSAAMLLNYYGVSRTPSGNPTNPQTLNDWLNQNQGYAFGALKWNSVAAYSVRVNENFGTQKIRFVGVGSGNDFDTLNTDLANSKPEILEEPGHFIVANAKQDPTYQIADPAYENKKTLATYSNNFLSSRRYEKTNTDLSSIYISSPTPNDLFITDSLGRSTGKNPETGEILTQIPNSYYFVEPSFTNQTDPNSQVPNTGVTTLVIINPEEGSFTLDSKSGPIDVSAYDTLGNIQVKNFETVAPDTFELNYSPNTGSTFKVFQKVSIDLKPQNINKGNGVFPIVIKSDDNFNVQDIDFQSIQLSPSGISPIKFPLLVSNGKDNKKDLQIFFLASQISRNNNLCLTGTTISGIQFKGCT